MDETFRITDDKSADWAIRKIKEEAEEKDRLISLANSQIDDLKSQIVNLEQNYETKTGYLKGLLSEYFDTVQHKETKTQESYKLLSGSLVMKKPSQRICKDDDSLVTYLEKNNLNNFVDVKKSPKWAEFKKQTEIIDGKVIDTASGEVIDCLTVEDVPVSFNVKF